MSDGEQLGRTDYRRTCLLIKSCFGPAHRSGKGKVAEIYRRTLDGVPFFIDNEAEAPVFMKERQSIASSIIIDSHSQSTVIFPSRIRT